MPPAALADEAFRAFCYPAGRRPPNYRALARRARFHLRHADVSWRRGLAVYRLEPSGLPKGTVLFIHGWSAEAAFLAAFAEPVRRAGYRVLAFDLPAHGRSEGKYTNLAACARAAHWVASEYGPLSAVAGHSLGALIALWIAEGGPPLPSMIPVPKIALLACPDRFAGLAHSFGQNLGLSPFAQRAFEQRISRAGRRPVQSFSAQNLLQKIESDIFAVHSTDDAEISFDDAEEIVAAYPGAQLLRCEGLGHAKLLYDPAVIRTVAAFLTAP